MAAHAEAADLDGDGDMDLITASASSASAIWYENSGGGSFRRAGVWEEAKTGLDEVRIGGIADFDGDSFPDLLVEEMTLSGNSWTLVPRIVFGSGLAGFGPREKDLGPDPSAHEGFAVRDLDGNGLPDLIGPYRVILNPGTASEPIVSSPGLGFSFYPDTGWLDWNGDGITDASDGWVFWEGLGGGLFRDKAPMISQEPENLGSRFPVIDERLPDGRGLLGLRARPGSEKVTELALFSVNAAGETTLLGAVPLPGKSNGLMLMNRLLPRKDSSSIRLILDFYPDDHTAVKSRFFEFSMAFGKGQAKPVVKTLLSPQSDWWSGMMQADLNGDGREDFLVSAFTPNFLSGQTLRYHRGTGKGGFSKSSTEIEPPAIVEFVRQLVDLDGDGDLDILTEAREDPSGKGQIAWHENRGHATQFTRHVLMSAPGYAKLLGAKDLDGNGKLEVAASFNHLVKDNHWDVRVMVSKPGARRGKQVFRADHSYRSELGDWDGDGRDDLLVWGEEDELSCFKGLPKLRFSTRGSSLGESLGETLYDADGDGDPDLVPMPESDYPNPQVWRENTGAGGQPEAHILNPGPTAPNIWATFADLDGNGRMDYLQKQAPVLAFANGNFQTLPPLPLGRPVFDDLDGDGDGDVVLRVENDDQGTTITSLQLLENQGGGSFVPAGTLKADFYGITEGILSGDLDGDGKKDIVVSHGVPARIEWYRGK